MPWTFFSRFLQQHCSTTGFYFKDIFQNKICFYRGIISTTKMFCEKLRFIVANPELGTLSTQCDWILGATYVSMCGWLGRGGFSPVFSKLPPTGTELLIHLLCPQHHGRLWWILSKNMYNVVCLKSPSTAVSITHFFIVILWREFRCSDSMGPTRINSWC